MKTLKIIVLFSVVILFAVTSCNKEEETSPSVTAYKSTITGYAYAQLDETIPGPEFVPQGTRIFAFIPTQQQLLVPDPNTTYPYKYYETTVGADGKYTFTFDIGSNMMQLALYADDFMYDRIISPSMTELTIYKLPYTNALIVPKQTKILNIYFTF